MPTDNELHAAVASLGQRKERKKILTEKKVQALIDAKPSFSPCPLYCTPVTLAGTGATISTENAWTKVTVNNGQDFAFIQFEVTATADADIGVLWFRDYRTNAEIDVATVSNDQDDAQPAPPYWVPLYTGTFEYKFVSSAGSPDFRIRHIGNPNV